MSKHIICLYTVFIMPLINFRPNTDDQHILQTLRKKMGLTVAAVIRQALRMLYKKEMRKEK